MRKEDIQRYLQMLRHALQERQVRGEILVANGVVMLLDIKQQEKRKDMDAYLNYLRGDGPAIERHKDILATTPAPFKMRNIYGGDRMFNHLPKGP